LVEQVDGIAGHQRLDRFEALLANRLRVLSSEAEARAQALDARLLRRGAFIAEVANFTSHLGGGGGPCWAGSTHRAETASR
jgi:hypothetical protein